jgi:hypothetical protein
MAYLRWSGSPWYAFSHVDGGDDDDAVLVAWHVRGAGASVTAGELRRSGSEGSPQQLRRFLDRELCGNEAASVDAVTAALNDLEALAPAVDRFLFEVYSAGRIAMPIEVANRYCELKRWIDEALADPCGEFPVDDRGVSMLFTWRVELDEIRRRYPPPRVPREIRELLQARALRVLRGEEVSPQQDVSERERIAAACEWPALRASRTDGRGA